MTQVNVDFSAVIASQVLSQLSQQDRDALIQESIATLLNGESIRQLVKEEALKIAKEEVQKQIQGNTAIRAKMVDLIQGAFEELLKGEKELKTKLAKGLVEALIRDRY